MHDPKLELWKRFCDAHRIAETAVPLFAEADGRVMTDCFGRHRQPILRRSEEMQNLLIGEVERALAGREGGEGGPEGIIYMMLWLEPDLLVRPLYVGRAGKYGRRGGNISVNLVNVRKNLSKFARWGSGDKYHVGDLSAAACPGHPPDKLAQKYLRWAERLFESAPGERPRLRLPLYFWATPGGRSPQAFGPNTARARSRSRNIC